MVLFISISRIHEIISLTPQLEGELLTYEYQCNREGRNKLAFYI